MAPKRRPIAELAHRTRYRYGDRDRAARREHTVQTTQWRREQALAMFEPVEGGLLRALADGYPLRAAAELAGVTVQAIHGRRVWDAEWAQRVDAALMEGRDPSLRHGTEGAYGDGCRCPECREAHNLSREGTSRPRRGADYVRAARRMPELWGS